MKNTTVIAQKVLDRYCQEHDSYCERFNKRNDIGELELDTPKSKGHELYVFTKQTLARHIVTELRGYELKTTVGDASQYEKSHVKSKNYLVVGGLYPAECFTRRELGHSIPKKQWDGVKYLPVVPLENRLAYHDRNRAIYEYYKVARAIIRYSGKVTRIIDGQEWLCARLDKDTYLVISVPDQLINDELSESISQDWLSKPVDEFYAVLFEHHKTGHKREPKADLCTKDEYRKHVLTHKVTRTGHIRPNRTEQVPFEKCVVYPKK